LRLPDDLDPADLLVQRGGAVFRELLESARDALEYKLDWVRRRYDLESLEGRNQAIESLIRIMAVLPVLSGEEQRVRQELVMARLAQNFGVSESSIRRRLSELRRQGRPGPNRIGRGHAAGGPDSSPAAVRDFRAEIEPAERDLFEAFLNDMSCVPGVVNEFRVEDLRSPELRTIWTVLGELCRPGEQPTLERLLNRLRQPALVELATTLAETGRGKGDVRRRIQDALLVIRGIRGARRDAEAPRLRAQLSQAAAEDEDRLLKLIEERERQRAARNRQLGREAI